MIVWWHLCMYVCMYIHMYIHSRLYFLFFLFCRCIKLSKDVTTRPYDSIVKVRFHLRTLVSGPGGMTLALAIRTIRHFTRIELWVSEK
jgi:hypothetical protein